MSDEERSAWSKQVVKPIYELALRGFVEVDHHVAAEYDVERTLHRPAVHQIQPGEVNHGPHGANDAKYSFGASLDALEVLGPRLWGDRLDPIGVIDAFCGACEHAGRNIRSQYLRIP